MSAAQISVPQVVGHKLRVVRTRRRWLAVLAGTAVAAALFCGLLLAAMLLDWLITPFESAPRVLMTATVLLTGTAAWIAWGLRPAVRRSPLPSVAGLIDSAVPELEERWTTIADLSQSSDPPEMRGSSAMIDQVAGEAERMHDLVQPRQIVSGRAVSRSLCGLAAALAVLAVGWLVDREQMSVLWQRFWSPTQAISLTQVSSPTAGMVVPRHEPVEIAGQLQGRVRDSATITLRDSAGGVSAHSMQASAARPAAFTFAIDELAEPVEYRIRAGDGQTAWHQIGVADRPKLTSIDFKITPPAYSQLPADVRSGLPRRTRALEGSTLEVAFTVSEPLQGLNLLADDESAIALQPSDEGTYRFQRELTEDFAFSPHLVSRHGLANEQPPNCRIIVYRDQFPSVAIVSPESDYVVRPDDQINIEFAAEDDFGIESAELVVTDAEHPEDAPLKVIEIPLGEQQNQTEVQGSVPLDLREFDLEHGASLSYSIRVFDTKQSAGQSRVSPASSDPQQGDTDSRQADKSGQPSDASRIAGAKSSPNENEPQSAEHETQPPDAQPLANSANSQSKQGDPQSTQPPSGSAPQPKLAGRTPPHDDSPQGKREGAPRPGDDMQRRKGFGQCTSCKPMNLKIDEWAGSFAGRQRENLELEIDAYLTRMEQALRDAERQNQSILDDVAANAAWGERQVVGARKAAGHLSVASDVAVELATTSAETPYAFMGLQLAEIDERHIVPATSTLQGMSQTPEKERPGALESSLFHIRRAREMLAALSRTYEGVKINHQIAEAMTHVKKMHQVFIEDTFKLLGNKRPVLNPKQRKFLELELDEEFRKKLKALLEKKRDVQAELAKVLAENPDLLRRFMSRSRVDADSYRDQLTLFARRQQTLHAETRSLLQTPDAAEAVLAAQHGRHSLTALEVANTAALMAENFETWLPRNLKLTDAAVAPVHRLYRQFAVAADRMAAAALRPSTDEAASNTDDTDSNVPTDEPQAGNAPDEQQRIEFKPPREEPNHAQQVYQLLGALEAALPGLAEERPADLKLTAHVTNRLAEVGKLTTVVSGWLRMQDAFEQQDRDLILLVQQNDLTNDTAELTNKIANLQSWMAGLTDEIGMLSDELMATLEDELLMQQATSEEAFEDHAANSGERQQALAVESFAKAEAQMDRLMDAIIAHLDSLPADTRPSLDGVEAQTLEDLLALLENEKLAAEGLGIPCCRPNNLSIVRDWLNPGKSGSGGGMGAMTAAGMLARTRDAQRRADRLQQTAEQRRRQLAEQMAAAAKQRAGAADRRPVNPRWNTLQSKLDDSLRQVRGQSPPPKYRSAIEQYFKSISGVTSGDPGQSARRQERGIPPRPGED